MNWKVRLSTKGRLIIPRNVRQRHGWDAGTELVLEDLGDRVVVHKEFKVPETTLEDLVGCTGYRGSRRSLKEMEEAVARGAPGAGGSS